MKYFLKLSIVIYFLCKISLSNITSYYDVILFLIITIISVYNDKYKNSNIIAIFQFAIITLAAFHNPIYYIFFAGWVFDISSKKYYYAVILPVLLGVYLFNISDLLNLLLVITISGYAGYINRNLYDKEKIYNSSYDMERKYRYELEETKSKLMQSSKKIAHITEIKERNRIAREIHDNIGHSIAGVLMQLQAAYKIREKNSNKSAELLYNSIEKLSSSLELLRETVHNIKPNETLGVEYIEDIIKNFSFCIVDFKLNGNFNNLPASYVEMIAVNIKEALTNASRYSHATEVKIVIDINDNFVRLYIKDNGTGCAAIKEGLGISGMKERVKNVGGSISISSDDGFLIVCLLPNNNEISVF